jgi:pimeloyl-ACP methyl ester carboxylesterase
VSDALDYLKPHTLLGHSMGGWLASNYASLCGQFQRPSANRLNYGGPESLILVNPSGVYSEERVKFELEGVFRTAMKTGFSHVKPYLFLREPFWFRYIEGHFVEFYQREDITQFLNSTKPEHDLQQVVSHIQSQVWMIWGEGDHLIPLSCLDSWLKSLNPEFKDRHHAVIMKSVGHCPQLEAPWVTSAVVGQILKSKIPSSLGGRWWTVLQ